MTFRTLAFLLLCSSIMLQGCFIQCISGGNLHIKKKFVSNICGLVNGVYVREIKVDSFNGKIPVTYSTLRSANLYKQGASANKDPKRLYYVRDCKRFLVWTNGKITDTVNQALNFKRANWYLFSSYDAHTDIFMFIDEFGKKHLEEVSGKSGLVNF